MKLYSMTLRRPNSRRVPSIRYRWNVIWSANQKTILIVECYGYASDKSYAWTINPDELIGFMRKRLDRFGYNPHAGDVLKADEIESIEWSDLNGLIGKWTAKNDWSEETKKAWDVCMYRFKNGPALGANADNSIVIQEMAMALVGEIQSSESVTRPPDIPRAANWGAW